MIKGEGLHLKRHHPTNFTPFVDFVVTYNRQNLYDNFSTRSYDECMAEWIEDARAQITKKILEYEGGE